MTIDEKASLKKYEIDLIMKKGAMDQQILAAESQLRTLRAKRAELPPQIHAVRAALRSGILPAGIGAPGAELVAGGATAEPGVRLNKEGKPLKPWEDG